MTDSTPDTGPDARILADRSPGELRVAILRDGRLAEFLIERDHRPWRLGEIVLARVTAVRRTQKCLFVDLGGEDGYLDGLPDPVPDEGAELMVEIAAEAARGKAARVSTDITLTGPLVTLTPGRPDHAVARRITAKTERESFRRALAESVPDGLGAMVEAAARGCDADRVAGEAASLVARWRKIEALAARSRAPARLAPGPGALDYARRILPDAALEEGRDGVLLDEASLGDALTSLQDRRLILPGGGAIVIDEMEALSAIDVDSGTAPGRSGTLATLAGEAAAEIAWQIRLRRIAGLILVDFPRIGGGRRASFAKALEAAVADFADRPTIYGWTRAGLLEMTRPRRGPSVTETLTGPDPGANLTPETVALDALRQLMRQTRGVAHPRLLCSHPVRVMLTGPLRGALDEAGQRLGLKVSVETRSDLAPGRYEIDRGSGT